MINFFKTLYIYFFPPILIQSICSLINFYLINGDLKINYFQLADFLFPIESILFCIVIPAYLTCITIYYSIKSKTYPSLKHNVLMCLSLFLSNIPICISSAMSYPKDAPPDIDYFITFFCAFLTQVFILTTFTLSICLIIYICKRVYIFSQKYKKH